MAVAIGATASPAAAKSYWMDSATIQIELQDDGSLVVTEELEFSFDGEFRGAFRDIPLRSGETITHVRVSEGVTEFTPGAPTALGSDGDPNTFGLEHRGDTIRIVWHYRAANENRTFTLQYRLEGATTVYDDVVDVNLKVWGDEWTVGVSSVNAAVTYPGTASPGEVLVWGHPAEVSGLTELGTDGVTPTLTAWSVSPNQFVEMRVVLPSSVLTTTDGAQVVEGNGLEEILAEEEAEANRGAREAAAIRTTVIGLLLALGLVAVALFAGYLRHGAERGVAYDREYEQEPPSDHSPALVGALLTQGHADEQGFTAEIFELIRRGALTAVPATTERKTWLGLKTETISDLEIGLGEEMELAPHEESVMSILRRVLGDGPLVLTSFRDEIRSEASSNHSA